MTMYEIQGHLYKTTDFTSKNCQYFPHYAVCKHDSVTKKLRDVFGGFARMSMRVSFNDLQMVGPTL